MGGHSLALLETAGAGAELVGLDRDTEALDLARQRLKQFAGQVHLMHMPFSHFADGLESVGWDAIDGALLDLGVSSLHLDSPERGFSFLADGPLDMRMDPSSGLEPAHVLVNTAGHGELARIIKTYGEDPLAGRIARAILEARDEAPIETTSRLASVVEQAYPAKMRRTARNHPATRTFQALRMAVNRELEELETFLRGVVDRLRPGGRVAIISFHSLEDRIVKHFFRDEAKECVCPPELARCQCGHWPRLKVVTRKPVAPSDEETECNSRARSAKLRVAERLDTPHRPEGTGVDVHSAEARAPQQPRGRKVNHRRGGGRGGRGGRGRR